MRSPRPLAAFAAVIAIPASAHNKSVPPRPSGAKYIAKEEIKAVDIGHENFAVGMAHMAGMILLPPTPCERQIKNPSKQCAYPGGVRHESQAEGYSITPGEGTILTNGYIVDGANYDLADLFGLGLWRDGKKVMVGGAIIIPAVVVNDWIDVPDHVDYIRFRSSPAILQAGWTHPAIRKSAPPSLAQSSATTRRGIQCPIE